MLFVQQKCHGIRYVALMGGLPIPSTIVIVASNHKSSHPDITIANNKGFHFKLQDRICDVTILRNLKDNTI
jgi:hypothetical protein